MSNYIDRLKSYNSYSGCDMVASVRISSHTGLKDSIYTLGSLQTISISTHQDKRPVRSIGNINAKEYTMGQRTIAGSLVFAVFDRHFADQMFKDSLSAINKNNDTSISTIMLPDELPPFDITISYANEYGHTSRMALYGVRLVDEGQVMSINDIYTENTYQFVATALEPLNKDENIGQAHRSSLNNKIEDTNKKTIIDKDDLNYIISTIPEDELIHTKQEVKLDVITQNANSSSDTGIATFTITPTQKIGYITIHGSNNFFTSISLQDFPDSSSYHTYLTPGSYYATYESNDKISNTVDFKINKAFLLSSTNKTNPLIDYVTDTSIAIISNDSNHDIAICRETNPIRTHIKEDMVISLKSRKALFKDLSPNTLYSIYTASSFSNVNASSDTSSVKTLKYQKELLDEFKTFISLNFNNTINNSNDLIDIINKTDTDKIHNIIDVILTIKEDEKNKKLKQELLYLAIKFQNYINYDLNKHSSLEQPIKYLSNPFYNTFTLPMNTTSCDIFKVEKSRTIFEEKIENVDVYEFLGFKNKRYLTYGVNDKYRGPRYDFLFFPSDYIDNLSDYYNSNELSKLSKDPIANTYKAISAINLNRLTAEYYKKPHIEYLYKPLIAIEHDLTANITINNDDLLSTKDEIVLAISEIEECLDFTSFKKVKTNFNTNIKLSSFYTGIKFNKSYAIWIENLDGMIISSIETFNTHINNQIITIEDENIKEQQITKVINNITKLLKDKTDINAELKNILDSEKSNPDSHVSIIYDNLIASIINNKNAFENLFSTIAYIYKTKADKNPFITDNFKVKATYDKTNKKVLFNSYNKIRISAINIDEFTGEVNKHVDVYNNNTYVLNNNSGFTLLSCISDTLYGVSGFIIIDNKNGKFISYKLDMEVI